MALALKFILSTSFLALLLSLSGCATYGTSIDSALAAFEQGDYEDAESSLESSLSSNGKDRLLYYLELGVIKHLQGEYVASNDLLEQASIISEAIQEKALSDQLLSLMANPRQSSYQGADHERVLLYYYKAINYLAIATGLPQGTARLDALEGSRVEARRLLLRLQALRNNEGDYASAKNQQESTFSSIFRSFSALVGNLINKEDLTYRDDALAHYITGLSFELNNEYDNARISYEAAANSYDSGYSEQFRLGADMAKDAWFDTVRMMKLAGNYENEWPKLASEKLTDVQQSLLESSANKAQILVLEHKGRVPEKQEMNLELAINPYMRSLQLEPYFFEHNNRNDQLQWFYMLYADKGITTLVSNYLNATRNNRLDFYTKTVFLGPAYYQLESLGITQAIGNSLRVTVPYYAPPEVYGKSSVTTNGQTWQLSKAASPQQMAIQNQMKTAGKEIRASLARSSFKALTATQVASQIGGEDTSSLFSFVGKIAAQLTDAAETRSWIFLPAEVYFKRLFLESGEHRLTLNSTLEDGITHVTQKTFNLKDNDIQLWQVRSQATKHNSNKQIAKLTGTINLSYNLKTTH